MSPHGAARVALPALPSVPDDGLVLWLMGDVGVYTDGSGQVVWWQDQSGRGGDVTQPTFAFRPTFVTSRFNGLPAVRFDGIDDYLTAQGIVATDAFTLFVIAAASTSIRIDSPGSGGTAGMTGQHYLLGVDNPGGDNSGACISLGTNGAAAYDYGNAYLPALAVYSAPIGTSCPLVIRYTSKTPTIYLCGAEVASGLTSPMSNVYPPNRIGGSDYGTFAGDIAEILIYNRAVDDTERAAVESYLQAKYACLPAPSPTPTATPRPTPTPTPTPHHTPRPTPHHTPRPTPYPTPTPTPILPPPPPTPTITPTPTPTPTPIPTPTPTAPPPPPTATPQPSGSPSPSGSPEPSPTPEPCVFDQSHHIGYGVSDTQIYASAAYITINRKGLLCGEATGATADAFSAAWASVGADGPAGTVWAQVGIIRKRINGAITYNVYTEVKTGPRDPQDHILHYNFPAPAVGTQVQFRCSLDVGTGVWYFYRSDLDPRHPFDHIDPVPGGYWQKGVTGTSASYAGEGRNHQDKVPGSVSKHCLFGGCCYWRTSEVNPIPGAVSPIDDIWEGYKSTPASEKKDFEIWDTRNP